MISILIVGAGKSSSFLIDYLLKNTNKRVSPWKVVIADNDEHNLKQKTKNYPKAEIVVLDINNQAQRSKLVKQADLVLSLMPPHLHILLAKDCLEYKKHLITSSYVSDEIRELNTHVKKAGLMFMCEMGLDPGIDHMTASLIFDGIRKVASDIISFKSYCGGLIAPISDNNPWHYKFSWNPKNIINAGKDGAHYLKSGNPVHLPYESLFAQNETIQCEGVGALAYYANRDSLSYIELYGLQEARDFMRATLRYPSFCNGWDALIKMGLTNTIDLIKSDSGSLSEATKLIVQYDDTSLSLENFVWKKYGIVNDEVKKMIQWLGLFAEKPQKIEAKTPGDILLNILEDKWKMQPEDKDMVVMQHEVIYKHKEVKNKLISSMVVIGDDAEFSAMAKTVGMPIAILAELIVNKKIKAPKGVVIPTMVEVYRPVLGRLEKMGMDFNDQMITDL